MQVPKFKCIKLDYIKAEFFNDERVKQYLPDEGDLYLLPRKWILDMLNSVLGKEFEEWIRVRLEARNEKIR